MGYAFFPGTSRTESLLAGGAKLWRACMGPNVMRLLSRWRQRVSLNGMNIWYISPLMTMSLSAGFDGISHL